MTQLVRTPLWEHQTWAVAKLRDKPRVLIADGMGVGKTLQAVERDLWLRHDDYKGATLVVAPLSTHSTWLETYKKETSLTITAIDRKDRDNFLTHDVDVYIMHYEALRLMPKLAKFKFGHVIFDECHKLKNRTAKQTKAAKKLRIPYITAMSGSPVTDHPQDIWQILNILYPKKYSSFWAFFEQYIDYRLKTVKKKSPDGKIRLVNYKEVVGPADEWTKTGLAEIRSWYVRRRQEECIDIPGKLYNKIEVDLYPPQRRIYDEMALDMLTWIKNSFGEDEALPAPAIIAKLSRLQLIALGTPEFGTPVTKKNGEVVTPIRLVDPSIKVDTVMEMLEDHDTEQFVIFSQFKGPLRLLRGRFEQANITYGSFTGDDNQRLRDIAKLQFIEGKRRILLGTIATGGVGVDGLQHAAANVIFLDRDWSPSLNDQAEDRLNRAGQIKHVNVYNLIARDTVDIDRGQKIIMKAGWVKKMLGDT